MSIFDGLGSVLSDVLAGRQVDYAAVATRIFDNAGGLQGIVSQLNSAGLGQQVSSWIGTGHNLPVSAEQIQAALSSDQLRDLAAKFGVNADDVSKLLAEHLPEAVDAATPNGTVS